MDLFEALSHPCQQVRRLLGMADDWIAHPLDEDDLTIEPHPPRQQPTLAERLGSEGVQAFIGEYRGGTTQQELADLHRTSVSSVKRLIRAQGAVRCRRGGPSTREG